MEKRFFLCLVPQDGTQCEGQALSSPSVRIQHMEMRVVSCDPEVRLSLSGLRFLCMEMPEISNCSSTAILGT